MTPIRSLTETQLLVRQWAVDRNLIEGSNPTRQMEKLRSELEELSDGIDKKDDHEIMDGIGDMLVVLTIIAAQKGWNLETCYSAAYEEIKDRKGRMIDGIFVKEADLKKLEGANPDM